MFKEIIATTLMCTAFGTPKLMNNTIETQVNDTPSVTYRTDNYTDRSATLNGTYALNDKINLSLLSDDDYSIVNLTFSPIYSDVFDDDVSFALTYMDYSDNTTSVTSIDTLGLSFDYVNDTFEYYYSFYNLHDDMSDYIDGQMSFDGNLKTKISTDFAESGIANLHNGDIYFLVDYVLDSVSKVNMFYAIYHKVNFTCEYNNVFTGTYVLRDDVISCDNISLSVYGGFNFDKWSLDWQSLGTSFILGYETYFSEMTDVILECGALSYYTLNNTYWFYAHDLYLEYFKNSATYLYAVRLTDDSNLMNYSLVDVGATDGARTMICFTDSVYLTGFWRDFINTFFTKVPNRYWTSYTGWYTFNETIDFAKCGFVGSFMANNNLYNSVGFDGNNVLSALITLANYRNGDYYDTMLCTNGTWDLDSRRIYLSGVVMPIDVYQVMLINGSFAYIPSVENTTFKELIFAIVDAPVKMLTDLFDVQLLGIKFYVVFMGIVSVVLIAFILRKII